VPGDIIEVNAGDKISADARIIESESLQTDESSLTGESTPVSKTSLPIFKKIGLADKTNILFSGTTVTQGRAKAVVIATAMETEIGKIASLVQSVEETRTPLKNRLTHLGKWMGISVITASLAIIIIGVIHKQPLAEMLLVGVSLAVSAIPEGLPAVITVTLALSVNSMVKRKALVKKLKAIETLGNISTICTDKTGTLTRNEMTVAELYVNSQLIKVTGSGFSTKGSFLFNNKKINSKEFSLLLEAGASCNNASLPNLGDPTEIALLISAAKANVKKIEPRINEVPFDSEKKYMITEHRISTKKISYIKGAPEEVLKLCKYIKIKNKILPLAKYKKEVLEKNSEMAKNALRVLAMAYKENNKTIFLGLQGMIDPPRNEVKNSIKLCKDAGIRIIMITGDHKLTAKAIAKEVGIEGEAIDGNELDKLSDSQLKQTLKTVNIFARASPQHKVRILNILQKQKQVVAMTGDGINDAPALKQADVGVAMAIKGTDIARDAADMILLNDNFASIVNAIQHGRVVYENIKKFIKYELSVNFSELFLILIAIFLKLPLPLLPLQILWINLTTNGLPALALSVENPDRNIMKNKPRDPKESIFKGMKYYFIFGTLFVFSSSLIVFLLFLDDLTKARTMTLSVSILFQMFFVFTCRSNESLFKIGWFSNKKLFYAVLITVTLHLLLMYSPISAIFSMTQLNLKEWTIVVLLASTGLIVFEITKLFNSHKKLTF
ncbi:MAG: cation-translocating P-type ATPase, partial [Nanoarchaeota archaeon]|nr:cation-translocating P-type ATPase [Nanoarchaeota archaeon]